MSNEGEKIRKDPGVPLAKISGFEPPVLAVLAAYGITTAEGLVAAGNTAEKRKSLASVLNMGEQEASALISSASRTLPPRLRKEMETPVDTSRMGLGAIKPASIKSGK